MNSDLNKDLWGVAPQGWRPVVGHDYESLSRRLASLGLPGRVAELRATGLPFYDKVELCEAIGSGTRPPCRTRFLRLGDELAVLDGSAQPVHRVNERAGLRLTAATVLDYVTFFFAHVRGTGEGFRLVGTLDAVPFHGEASEEQRRRVGSLLVPLAVVGSVPQGFLLDGTVLFLTGLYRTTFVVSREGDVSTMGEKLLMEDVPAFVRLPQW